MKPKLIRAWLECRCPHCRTGKVFPEPAFHPVHFHQMNESCPHCGVTFIPEPGFYFGAMYVSFAFTVALMTAVWLFLRVLFNPAESIYIGSLIGTAFLLAPLSFRYSRMIWLYWFG